MTAIDIENDQLYIYTNEVDEGLEKICSYVDPDAMWRIKETRKKAEDNNDQRLLEWINQWDGRVRIYKRQRIRNKILGYKYVYEIPIGMLDVVRSYYTIKGYDDISDNRFNKQVLRIEDEHIAKQVKLREGKQIQAGKGIEEKGGRGIVEAVTGFGKTILGIYSIQLLRNPTLILVDLSTIISQWDEVITEYFDLHRYKNGNLYVYTTNKHKGLMDAINDPYDIAIVLGTPSTFEKVLNDRSSVGTSERNIYLTEWVDEICDHVIYDEVHFAGSDTAISVLDRISANTRLGFSATVGMRSDGKDLEYIARVGSIIYTIRNRDVYDMESIPLKFLKVRPMQFTRKDKYNDIKQRAIIYNKQRNDQIIRAIDRSLDDERRVIVFVENIEHARHLSQLTFFPYTEAKDPEKDNKIAEFKSGMNPVLFATYKLLGVGYDDPTLDTVILAGAGRGGSKMIQAVGRILRQVEGKKPMVYDFADNCKTFRDQAVERLNLWVNETIYKIDVRDTYLSRYLR